jgi:hypothetical protein
MFNQPALYRSHELKKEGDKMKKLFYRLASNRSFTKLLSIPIQPRLEERKRVMFCRKSFLVFLLAFAALTLGRGNEAMAQWDWDWGDLPPGSIDGGSTAFVYHCTQGQGTNTLTLGDPDIFTSSGSVICNFTGQFPGSNIACSYDLTFTGDLVTCTNTSAGALVTVKSTCDNVNGVSGQLTCAAQNDFPGVTDLLGISSKNECKTVWGRNANTLFTQATYAGQTCNQVLAIGSNAGLKFGGLTQTTTQVCHSDGGSVVDCITQGNSNKSSSAIPNLIETACNASPQTWNADCSGNKDNGNGRVCFLNGQAGFASFDPTQLNATTATLNGVPVATKQNKPLFTITDCNGDGIPDAQFTFPTCTGGNATAAPPLAAELGELTMLTSFTSKTGDISGLICTTHVATSGQLP